MKKNLCTLAIIFSVTLNIVFVSSHIYRKLDPRKPKDHQESPNRLLYEELNLSPEQLKRFEPIRDSFHAFRRQQSQTIKTNQLELIDLLAKETPDRKAIDAKKEEIQILQQQMKAKVIDHFLEESRIFTTEQREKFFALIKKRIETSSGLRPRWMPQTQRDPSKGELP